MITKLIIIYLLTECNKALPQYNEKEALILFSLSAGAYSDDPGKCVGNTLPEWQKWLIYNRKSTICDAFQNSCSFYAIKSDVIKEIIIVYRGTTTIKQLIVEGLQSMRAKNNFFDVGKVNRYFSDALEKIWPDVQLLLQDPKFMTYRVTFTGHSLGGALASLAATRTVVQGLRTGNQIKLVTFGQPRTGDYQFAMYHNANIPFSFRVVHGLDVVPHLPPCERDKKFQHPRNISITPCLPGKNDSSYHHGTEIWYPDGMAKNARYRSCLSYPRSEDLSCSNSLKYDLKNYNTYIADHRNYFNINLVNFGKRGCTHQNDSSFRNSSRFATYFNSLSQKLVQKGKKAKQGISNFLNTVKQYFKNPFN